MSEEEEVTPQTPPEEEPVPDSTIPPAPTEADAVAPPEPSGPGSRSDSEGAAAPAAPAPSVSEQVEAAMRKVRDDEKHQKEHEEIAARLPTPQEEAPKKLLDKLKWGG